jgi:hypothetical protein
MHHDASPGSRPERDEKPCDTPIIPTCCHALASCTGVLSAPESRPLDVSGQQHGSHPQSVSRLPRSEIVAPDPPPPRT